MAVGGGAERDPILPTAPAPIRLLCLPRSTASPAGRLSRGCGHLPSETSSPLGSAVGPRESPHPAPSPSDSRGSCSTDEFPLSAQICLLRACGRGHAVLVEIPRRVLTPWVTVGRPSPADCTPKGPQEADLGGPQACPPLLRSHRSGPLESRHPFAKLKGTGLPSTRTPRTEQGHGNPSSP